MLIGDVNEPYMVVHRVGARAAGYRLPPPPALALTHNMPSDLRWTLLTEPYDPFPSGWITTKSFRDPGAAAAAIESLEGERAPLLRSPRAARR